MLQNYFKLAFRNLSRQKAFSFINIIGLAIGLALTLIHLISIPVTNTSVNPARSLGPAVFVGGWAITQLWLFWVAPLIGAILAGLLYPMLARGSETYADADA